MSNDRYTIIREFVCQGKHMITVRIGNAVHVMDYSDWQLIYECNYRNEWKGKTDWNRFVDRENYNRKNAS